MAITFNDLPDAVNNLHLKLDELEKLICEKRETIPIQREKPLTVKEAAKFLQIAVPTLYDKVSKKEIPHIKAGGKLYFLESDLMDWLKEKRVKMICEIQANSENYLTKRR
ncbi:MAG: helix-turn-helix domain-containing protein [Bacteroidetes bacterium]|nr:helix-turn-helix domain-containing protein [Bacteroidota bacterium]